MQLWHSEDSIPNEEKWIFSLQEVTEIACVVRQRSFYFDCHSGLDPESRVPDENRDPKYKLDSHPASLGFAERRAPRRAFAGMTK